MDERSVAGLLIIAVFLFVFFLAGIFHKAGKPAALAFIPIVNAYIFFKITTGKAWLGLLHSSPFLFVVFGGMLQVSGLWTITSESALQIVVMTCILSFAISVYGLIKLGDAFGKGGWFKFGLLFFTNIFVAILAFGSSEYIGYQSGENQSSPLNNMFYD